MKYVAGLVILIILGLFMVGVDLVVNNIAAIKVIGMWLGLALIIHFAHVRAYMLAWVASGHVTKWGINWHDFIFEIILYLTTLALWLDKFKLL